MKDNFVTLQDNVRLLGTLLGDTVREAHGQALFDKVEKIRGLSKLSHTKDGAIDLEAVSEALLSLSNDELIPVARAFSQFLNLVNIAENYQAVSFYQDEDAGSVFDLDDVYAQLGDKHLSDEEIGAAVSKLKIELVLTAHPTEVIRRTLIHKYNEISECLKQLDANQLPEHEAALVNERLRELIAQAWHTNEICQVRPTPVDEAKWGFAVIENSLWDAVPRYLRQLDRVQKKHVGKRLPLEASPIRFVSWMGGDRDGNPNVTADVTREVMLLSRWKAVDLYLPELETLTNELSMSTCNHELRQLVGDEAEPYRALLHRLRARLHNTRAWVEAQLAGGSHSGDDIITQIEDLWEPLHACYRSLHEVGIGIVAEGRLLDLLRRIRCFGIHLVRLDIRQESSRHAQVFSELNQYLGLGDYASWGESQKQAFLLQELDSKRPLFPLHWQPSADVEEVINTCRVIAQQPRQALGAYVISMAKVPSDVLAVKLLLKEVGCPFTVPVVPLFETLDDLNNAAGAMNALFDIDWYREQIDGWQMVMIGYSDSAKDAGTMAASWAQYRAQEALIKTCADHEVALTLFHGRGGTIGRGGVSAHAAMLSQPPGSLLSGMRVTEQGETIRTKLGLPDVAIKTFNLYTHAILEAYLQPPPSPRDNWRGIMDKLSEISCEAYRDTVYKHPEFVPYFRQATPELELGKLPLGSRPAKRNAGGGVESLRAIPWIFAWTQNRMMLPAWLGAGAAISAVIAQGYKSDLETMCREWPFFSTRLGMLEMVYAKADVMLAEYYDQRLVTPELWPLGEALRTQLQQDIATVLDIANDEHLMQHDPWIQKAIELRKVYTDPLNVLQAELLCRNRKKPNPEIERAMMVTIAGVAAGMRNTG